MSTPTVTPVDRPLEPVTHDDFAEVEPVRVSRAFPNDSDRGFTPCGSGRKRSIGAMS
jgi:hypothetical protein